jgi:hypothetical protein
VEASEAKAALGSIEDARMRLAAVAVCPPWRHAVFGLIMAALVVSVAFPTPLQMALLACALAGIAIVASTDRRRKGVFVNGWRRGPTLLVSVAIMAMMLGLMFIAAQVRDHGAPVWWAVGAGLGAFALGAGGSLAWQAVYVRSLRKRLNA